MLTWRRVGTRGTERPGRGWLRAALLGSPGVFGSVGLSSALCPQTRRSMVFARHLRAVGDEFRSKHLNSTDASDKVPFREDWTQMKVASPLLLEKRQLPL